MVVVRIKELLLHAVAVEVGMPPPDRGRSRGHRSLCRVCTLKEEEERETTQMPAQKEKEKSPAIQNRMNRIRPKIHCFACSAPKRETFEGRVGPVMGVGIAWAELSKDWLPSYSFTDLDPLILVL